MFHFDHGFTPRLFCDDSIMSLIKVICSGPKNAKDYLFLIPYLLAVCLGLKFGYDFGMQISGPIMAVITAVIGAVFCSIVVESFLGKKRRGDSK